MNIVVIEGKKLTDRASAHAYISEKLNFPDYYGKNLDALADCLSEIDRDIVVVICDQDAIVANLDKYGKILLQVFKDCLRKKQLIIL